MIREKSRPVQPARLLPSAGYGRQNNQPPVPAGSESGIIQPFSGGIIRRHVPRSCSIIAMLALCLLTIHASAAEQEAHATEEVTRVFHPSTMAGITADSVSVARTIAALIQNELDVLNLDDIVIGFENRPSDTGDHEITVDVLTDSSGLINAGEIIVITDASLGEFPDTETGTKKARRTGAGFSAYFSDGYTGEVLGHMQIHAAHSGGSSEESREMALKALRRRIRRELKKCYWLSAGIESSGSGKPAIPLGSYDGLEPGMVFEIMAADRWIAGTRGERFVEGGPAGLAVIADTTAGSSTLHTVRQWRNWSAGSWVLEHFDPLYALQFRIAAPSVPEYTACGFFLQWFPLNRMDWGLGIQIIRVTDTRSRDDYGFGFSGFGLYRFFRNGRIRYGFLAGCDIDIPFRKDDDDFMVSAFLLSAYSGINAEYTLSRKWDLVFTLGYRLGLETASWEYSMDDERYPAWWDGEAPSVNNTGIFFSAGLKLII